MPRYPQLLHRATMALVLGVAGCQEKEPPAPRPEADRLEPVPETIEVKPGESEPVAFRLVTAAGQPIAGREVKFAIIDDAETVGDEANGATLSADSGVTSATGIAYATLKAGLAAIFRVNARTTNASGADVVVFVGTGVYGTAEVTPFFLPGSTAPSSVTTVDTFFFDGQACSSFTAVRPPIPVRGIKSIAPDGMAQYASISTSGGHAIVGRGRDGQGAILALGCVDLPGVTLVAGSVVRVVLPLADLRAPALGEYAVASLFRLDAVPKVTMALAGPWTDLSDCPLDPGQLWLDCTIDALGGAEPTDPLDCKPSSDGPLGDRLSARRGTAGPTGCRAATDALDKPSHDALAAGLFATPRPPLLLALPAIAQDATHLLDLVKLESVLTINATSVAGRHQADHQFEIAELTLGGNASRVQLPWLGLPILTARHVPAVERDGAVHLAAHGITLRLGSLARGAFGELALEPRAAPPTPAALLEAIAKLATHDQGKTKLEGCAALDAVLCGDLGEPLGCLAAACADGLAALAERLDAGFRALDGDDLDFLVDGSAIIVDANQDGVADRLGNLGSMPASPGLWSAELRARGGTTSYTGIWSGERR